MRSAGSAAGSGCRPRAPRMRDCRPGQDPRTVVDMTDTTVSFADDVIATATAAELAQRIDLVRQLAEHPGINRAPIEAQLLVCRELHEQLGAYLATIVLP